MIRAAIFDMDGLMFDTEKYYDEEWERLIVEFGYEADPRMAEKLRGTNGTLMEGLLLEMYPGLDVKKFVKTTMERVEKITEEGIDVKPGLYEILDYLKEKNVRMIIASGSLKKLVVRNLKNLHLDTYFEDVVTAEDVPQSKPAPDIYLEAARRLQMKPEDCCVLEDSSNGIRGAVRAGCLPVMVPDVEIPAAVVREACAGIYDSLLDVMEAMKKGELPVIS